MYKKNKYVKLLVIKTKVIGVRILLKYNNTFKIFKYSKKIKYDVNKEIKII